MRSRWRTTTRFLHLDIKPDNVLINRQGQVKVTDFAWPCLLAPSGFGAAGGGTIGYMPLEQMRQESLDARCDEWALASVTYEMLAGENPFLAPDLVRAEAAIEDAELVLPSLCWEELDPAVDDVIFCALDPDREERYDNVAEFAEEMEPFLGDPKRGARELAAIVGYADEEEADDEPAPARASRARRCASASCHGIDGRLRGRSARCGRRSSRSWLFGKHSAGKRIGQPVVLGAVGAGRPCGRAQAASGRAAVVRRAGRGAHRAGGASCGLRADGGHGCLVVLRRTGGRCRGERRFDGASGRRAGRRPVRAACGGLVPASCPRVRDGRVFPWRVAAIWQRSARGSLLGWDRARARRVCVRWRWRASRPRLDARAAGVLVRGGSWPVAAFACAVVRRRRTRAFAVFGAICAASVLAAGICAAAWVASDGLTWMPSVRNLAGTVVPVVVMLLVCVLMPGPARYEEGSEEEEA